MKTQNFTAVNPVGRGPVRDLAVSHGQPKWLRFEHFLPKKHWLVGRLEPFKSLTTA